MRSSMSQELVNNDVEMEPEEFARHHNETRMSLVYRMNHFT